MVNHRNISGGFFCGASAERAQRVRSCEAPLLSPLPVRGMSPSDFREGDRGMRAGSGGCGAGEPENVYISKNDRFCGRVVLSVRIIF